MDNLREDFIKSCEEKYNGKITLMMAGKYLGEGTSGKYDDKYCIFYIINNTLYFEDFEKTQSALIFTTQKSKYEKFESSINLNKLISIKKIKSFNSKDCISGKMDQTKVHELNSLIHDFLFSSNIQICVDNKYFYFDFVNNNKFYKDIMSLYFT